MPSTSVAAADSARAVAARGGDGVPATGPADRAGREGERRPFVSVIVPTFNRATTLADTLGSLARLRYPADRLEVIVVDNSSTDRTPEVVAAARRAAPFPVIYARVENRGPAVARNVGVARSRGELLAFTDSDCAAPPDWLANLVRRLGPGVGLVAGPVRPVINPERVPSFFYHQTDHRRPNDFYPTANVLYPRRVFEQVGGFDAQYGALRWGPPVGGEDIDLAWRVKAAGYRAAWADDAPVDHEATSIPAKAWLLDPVRSRIMPQMAARYPGIRRSFHWRWFTGRENAAFYLALAGLVAAAAGRRRLGLIGALPWLWVHRPMVERDLWPPARWWRIPLKYGLMAARSAVLAAVLVGASVRNRTVVL